MRDDYVITPSQVVCSVGFICQVCVMRIRIIFSLSVMQFQTFLELSYNL